MFFRTVRTLLPQKSFSALPFFKACYTAQEIDGHRSWNIGSYYGVHIEAPDISISNRTILYAPRNAISPYAARAIYFVFPGEHIFCDRNTYRYDVELDGPGIIGTVLSRLSFFLFLFFSPPQMEYFLDIKILNIMIECTKRKDIFFEFKLIII